MSPTKTLLIPTDVEVRAIQAAARFPQDGSLFDGPMSRRLVLQRLLAGGATLAVVAGMPARANAFVPFIVGLLKGAATALVTALATKGTEELVKAINGAGHQRRPQPRTFHDRHAVPYALTGRPVPLLRTRYGTHFEYDDLARFDRNENIPAHKDLNVHEMQRIVHPGEVRTYGCVVFPCGERQEPRPADDQGFAQACRAYRTSPQKLDLEYVRPFNDGKKELVGYGVASAANPDQKDLLISV